MDDGVGIPKRNTPRAGASTLTEATAQIMTADGRVVGAGFLVEEQLLVTCAHVAEACGAGPGGTLEVAFPALPSAPRRRGLVLAEGWRSSDGDDVAMVGLTGWPVDAPVLRLGSAAESSGHPVITFGFPADMNKHGRFGRGTALHLLPPTEEMGRRLQLSDANDITVGFSGSPVLDQVTGLVIGMVKEITRADPMGRVMDVTVATPAEELRGIWPALVERRFSPYRGMEPFTADDARWFHGREAVVETVLSTLTTQRRALLLGPSGAGKSSLIQAGVLPAVAGAKPSAPPRGSRWLPVVARPRGNLLAELERAGLPGAAADGIVPAMRRRLAAEPDGEHVLLVVDQFEELLAALDAHPPAAAGSGPVDELLAALDVPDLASVILVMRNDFYPRLAELAPGLLAAMGPGVVDVPATLSVPELRAVIREPAKAARVEFEEGLPERIIDDLLGKAPLGQTGHQVPVTSLPVLEVTLTQLWEKRSDALLTHSSYRGIGGVTGSMTAWCGAALAALSEAQRTTARQVLTALVRPGGHNTPATRVQRSLDDLRALATEGPSAPGAFDEVRAVLTNSRIVVTRIEASGQPVAELIHEALIRDWFTLRKWVAADHEFHSWLHRVGERQAHWARTRHPGDLLDGSDLAAARDWTRARGLPRHITAFLDGSRERRRRAARIRRGLVAALAGVLALAVLTVGLVLWEWGNENEGRGRVALSKELAAESSRLFESDPELAALLAVRAYRISDTPEARHSLRVAAGQPMRDVISGFSAPVWAVAYSPDGSILAAGGNDDTVHLLDAVTGDTVQTLTGHENNVTDLAFNLDGTTLASSSDDGTVRLWDMTTGDKTVRVLRHAEGRDVAGFQPGRRLPRDQQRRYGSAVGHGHRGDPALLGRPTGQVGHGVQP
ncbi:hypothetical protein GCM10022245_48280 [Streptomyces mayteni]